MTLTRTVLATAAISLAALSLAACASGVDGKGKGASGSRAADAINPLELYSLKTGNATDKIALALHDSGLHLLGAGAEAFIDTAEDNPEGF